MRIFNDISQLIGRTPIIRLTRFAEAEGLDGELLAKAECFNPGGSAKDRIAAFMLDAAEKSGALTKGGTVIEPTSGNTGIGLAMVCAVCGYKLILTMPESMSAERRKTLSALGARIILTPAAEGMQGAVNRALELADEITGSFIPGQFENPANPAAHEQTTAEEIISDLDGRLDWFAAGVGTGGTVTGVGRALKARVPGVKIAAVEPFDSPLLNGGKSGPHKLQGIGANFVPKVLDRSVIDRIIDVKTDEAYSAARLLGRTEGFTCGISGGAALFAAAKLLKENAGGRVLVLLPDGGDRYLSTDLFEQL
ncbi:MAG: cysteine synthase A [Christensenellales bacterium]